jgi:hypothetical protein
MILYWKCRFSQINKSIWKKLVCQKVNAPLRRLAPKTEMGGPTQVNPFLKELGKGTFSEGSSNHPERFSRAGGEQAEVERCVYPAFGLADSRLECFRDICQLESNAHHRVTLLASLFQGKSQQDHEVSG